MEISQRQKQIGVAQKNYRQKRKREGDIRVQFYIKKELNEKLKNLSQKKGISKWFYIFSLLENEANNQISDKTVIISGEDGYYAELSKNQLIAIIKKQQFWLNRLQQVNDALMKK